MDISLNTYKLLSITLDNNEIELDDETVSRLATMYRKELPSRHDLSNNYVATDYKHKRMLAIDKDSIMVRNNSIENFEEVANFSSDVLVSISNELNIKESDVSITIAALYKSSVDDVHPISIDKLFPSTLKKESLPGDLTSVGIRIVSENDDFNYDFRIEPSYQEEDSFIVSLSLDTFDEIEVSESTLYNLLVDSKQLLDETIMKIAHSW